MGGMNAHDREAVGKLQALVRIPTVSHTDEDEIDDAAADSFPASDPPAWTPHRAGHPAAVS